MESYHYHLYILVNQKENTNNSVLLIKSARDSFRNTATNIHPAAECLMLLRGFEVQLPFNPTCSAKKFPTKYIDDPFDHISMQPCLSSSNLKGRSHFTLKGCEKLNPSMLIFKYKSYFSFAKLKC